MAQITFEDKVAIREINLPRKNTITAEDINEIKASVNNLYEGNSNAFFVIDFTLSLEITFTAPYDLIIESQSIISGSPTVTYLVDETSYTFGTEIAQGSIINISVNVSSVISLSISGENVNSIYFVAGYKHLGNSNLTQDDAIRTYNIDGNLLVFSNGQVSIGTPLSSNYAFEINNSDFAGGILVVGPAVGVRGTGGSIGGLFEGTTGVQAYSSSGPAVQGISQGGGVAGFFQGGGYFETYGLGGSKDASALVHLRSTSSGFLIPEMTTADKIAITGPKTGLQVFDIDYNRPEFFNGSYWAGKPQTINIVSGSANLTAGSNYFFGNTAIFPTTTAANRQFISPVSGVIRKAFIRAIATVAGDRSISVYIRVNSTDYLIATVSSSVINREFINTSLNIPIVANTDTVVCYAVASGGTTDSTGVFFGGQIIVE